MGIGINNLNSKNFSLSSLISDFNSKEKTTTTTATTTHSNEDRNHKENTSLLRKIKDIHTIENKRDSRRLNIRKAEQKSKNIRISDISSMSSKGSKSTNKRKISLVLSELEKKCTLKDSNAEKSIRNISQNCGSKLIPKMHVSANNIPENNRNMVHSEEASTKAVKKIKLSEIVAANVNKNSKKSINEIKDIRGVNNFQKTQGFVSLEMKLFPVHLMFNKPQITSESSMLEQVYDAFCKLKNEKENSVHEKEDETMMRVYDILNIEKLNEFIYRIITTKKNEIKKYLLNVNEHGKSVSMSIKKVKINERFKLRICDSEYFYCWEPIERRPS